MAKLSAESLRERSDHILDAAERCFARAGFHRTTMQDICREAAVSPGALYLYFSNKEALIAGIAERERAEFADRFAQIAGAPSRSGWKQHGTTRSARSSATSRASSTTASTTFSPSSPPRAASHRRMTSPSSWTPS